MDKTKFALASQGTKNVWTYETTDAIGTVTGSGYFNDVAEQLDQFDIIMCVCATGGTPTIDTIIVTSASRAAIVTTSGTEGITVT